MLLLRLPGSLSFWFATRAFLALLFQEPPRFTRFEPSGAPSSRARPAARVRLGHPLILQAVDSVFLDRLDTSMMCVMTPRWDFWQGVSLILRPGAERPLHERSSTATL